VLTAQSLNVDTNGIPVEYSATRFPADRMEFSIESMSLNDD
jgi:GntR family phosphonate transport system transcriptional regulator